MRRLLIHTLMFLMITPAMVCLMPCCPDEAVAAPAEKPCHEMAQAADVSVPVVPAVPMLGRDCLANDLGAAAISADFPAPQGAFLPALALLFIPALTIALPLSAGLQRRGADPPPGEHPSFHRLLLTHRLRP